MLYTKKGDKGKTRIKNRCVSKASQRISAIGALDEVNSYLGIITAEAKNSSLKREVKNLQADLMLITSILAGTKVKYPQKKTDQLEEKIDYLEGNLPQLQNFLLPGGSMRGARLMYARTLARRAERELVELGKKQKLPRTMLAYLNRLSDYLFVLSRNENYKRKMKEEIWHIQKR